MKKIYILSFVAIFSLFSCRTTTISEFNDLVRQNKDGVCHLRSGNFYPIQTILVPAETTIVGHRTKIRFDDKSSFPIFRASQISGTTLQHIEFAGRQLVGQIDKRELEKYNYQFVLEMHNSSNFKIDHCRFSNSYGTTIHLSDCRNITFHNSEFRNIGVSTIGDGAYSYDAIIVGASEKTENVSISGCDFRNIGTNFPQGVPSWPNDGDGVHIQGQGIINDIKITGNRFDRCAARGVKVQSGSNINILNNHFSNCWTAVNMAMATDIFGINIMKNKLKKCRLSFGTDCLAGETRTVYKLSISDNIVDSCIHFFRTSGSSIVNDAIISGNKINSIATYFFTGRLLNTTIENNTVLRYATANNPVENMAIYISPESDNLSIINNFFGKSSYARQDIINRSSKTMNILGNTFAPPYDKTK